MNDSDFDASPFAERKMKRMVWIVPSVLLHVIILVVWLSMPKAPPREPTTQRKLTINSEQAKQLQQHVEDANLVLLHSKVKELQEIKKAMAQIRKSKMDNLRSFESSMTKVAPKDATDLFTQFMSAQTKMLKAYQELLQDITESETKVPAVKKLLAEENLSAAAPLLAEINPLWDNALLQLQIIHDETMLSYALVNSGEVQLEWIHDPTIGQEHATLTQTMQDAQSTGVLVNNNINKYYGGNPAKAMKALSEKSEANAKLLKNFADAKISGEAAAEQKRQELKDKIAASEAEIKNIQLKVKPLIEERDKLRKQPGKGKEADKLNGEVHSMVQEISKKESQNRNDKSRRGKVRYTPDPQLTNRVKYLRSTLANLYRNSAPEPRLIADAIQTQLEVIRASKTLLETIARHSASSTPGGAE